MYLVAYTTCDQEIADDAVEYLREVLTSTYKSYTFVYLGAPDITGHSFRWCDPAYMGEIDTSDAQAGQILDLLDELGKKF